MTPSSWFSLDSIGGELKFCRFSQRAGDETSIALLADSWIWEKIGPLRRSIHITTISAHRIVCLCCPSRSNKTKCTNSLRSPSIETQPYCFLPAPFKLQDKEPVRDSQKHVLTVTFRSNDFGILKCRVFVDQSGQMAKLTAITTPTRKE